MPRPGTGARTLAQKLAGLALLLVAIALTGAVMHRIVHGPDCTVPDFATHQRVLCNADQDPRAWLLTAGLLGAGVGIWLARDAGGPLFAVWLASLGVGPLIAALQPHTSGFSRVVGWGLGVVFVTFGLYVLYVSLKLLREPAPNPGLEEP